MMKTQKTYIVEHLDPELGPWSSSEYQAIAKESLMAGAKFRLSSVPKVLKLPMELLACPGFSFENQSVEEMYRSGKDRVCLLDPAAKAELSLSDADVFDVFLFGGILGRVAEFVV